MLLQMNHTSSISHMKRNTDHLQEEHPSNNPKFITRLEFISNLVKLSWKKKTRRTKSNTKTQINKRWVIYKKGLMKQGNNLVIRNLSVLRTELSPIPNTPNPVPNETHQPPHGPLLHPNFRAFIITREITTVHFNNNNIWAHLHLLHHHLP